MTSPPFHSDGMHYGKGPDGKLVCRGARLGRVNRITRGHGRLHLTRVRLDKGGYDKGGAYWGRPHLWCAWAEGVEVYVDGANRRAAAQAVCEVFTSHVLPAPKFLRSP